MTPAAASTSLRAPQAPRAPWHLQPRSWMEERGTGRGPGELPATARRRPGPPRERRFGAGRGWGPRCDSRWHRRCCSPQACIPHLRAQPGWAQLTGSDGVRAAQAAEGPHRPQPHSGVAGGGGRRPTSRAAHHGLRSKDRATPGNLPRVPTPLQAAPPSLSPDTVAPALGTHYTE